MNRRQRRVVVNKLLTITNFENTNKPKRIKYIVIHYVGAEGGAEDNCRYFYSKYRASSAHYFVGHEGEIWQCVDDADVAWHCGAKKYKHKKCRNANSIGIEMCCKKNNNQWSISSTTINSTINLVKELMEKYNIPVENVVRHYDVTGKVCPEPFVRDEAAWRNFKAALTAPTTSTTGLPYLVKITAAWLNVRAGAGVKYKINTAVKKNGVYTIVAEQNGWGKLKSGAGWINLKYTKRV